MTFQDAKEHLIAGAKMRRESWFDGTYVFAIAEPGRPLKFIDESSRENSMKHTDFQADDWIILETAEETLELLKLQEITDQTKGEYDGLVK